MIETDALVIGAGPAGLFAVFQLGLQGIAAQVIDVLDEPGGQCAALYPDKPIYDIPAVPLCTGRELTQKLLQQIAPFSAGFHFNKQVEAVDRQADGRWLVTSCAHPHQGNPARQQFLARVVIIAAGVGAFVPKELKVEGLAAFQGSQVFYRLKPADLFAGKHLLIVGGEDAAVQSAIALAQPGPTQAQSLTVLHRRDVLQATPEVLAEFDALRASGRITFLAGQVNAIQTSGERLTGVTMTTADNASRTLALDSLLVCQGISPKLGPIAHWGLAMARKQLVVDTASFATSAPGIFAVGDVITYPGKKKLIVSGFHEATLAAFAAAALIHPDASSVLQYTTSSAVLQRRLGVLPQP